MNQNVTQIRSKGAGEVVEPQERALSSYRARRSSSGRRSERRIQRLQFTLVLLVGVALLGAVTAATWIERLREEREHLVFQVRKLERDLDTATQQVAALRTERNALVEERIPGLRPLEYDQIIALDKRYVRNISFTLTNEDDQPMHEFRMVLSNDDTVSVIPHVEIVLFDKLGVQLGAAEVTMTQVSGGETTVLEPGHVRSYVNTIHLAHDEKPRYFVVTVK